MNEYLCAVVPQLKKRKIGKRPHSKLSGVQSYCAESSTGLTLPGVAKKTQK